MEHLKTIRDMTFEDLEKELIGKTVVAIDESENTLTLNDGRKLKFRDTADCCAWFNGELSAGNLTDNAVTALKVTDRQKEEYADEDYTIHIFAANNKIADLDINGNPTSGYYCHSINLEIFVSDKEDSNE
ncbi:hypothetical protein SEA_C3PO_61 [Corynebacterium phage C3PO]|uniref:DUF7448 domain-containing protein n=2 Tax=Corynebacterium virus C3PO TaxID=2560393 RepID=A0A3G3LWE1_9CAUD|nr:hypothetical protein FDJ10_gp82 [Corynebacterium phage C3PO]ATW58461.1 hypothetical protein SEA_C3PO_61 [Corynebacterium phage C3PO]AYQ98357.1 hypothetical protein CRUELLA_61 [Corynebacterium phage Cruella]